MKKLNMSFATTAGKNIGKAAGAAGAAYLYEEIAGAAVVNATAQDGKLSPFDVGLQILMGWGPVAIAAMQTANTAGGSPFWSSFGGAVMFNRIDNFGIAMGMKAMTRMGAVMPGETMDQARARLGS